MACVEAVKNCQNLTIIIEDKVVGGAISALPTIFFENILISYCGNQNKALYLHQQIKKTI